MLSVLRAVARFFRETIGWNRVGVMLSLGIIAVAAVVLYHALRETDVSEVIAALRATKTHQIVLALVFVVIGYASLTFYDLFALRTTGFNWLPYRIAALTGFTSYSIGHNVGASAFSGGAVRYRIYSDYGLSAVDVTKVCFVAGLTFWLGNATVLGLGVLYVPLAASAIDQLPLWLNRAIAVGILAALGSYIGWVSSASRVIGKGGWQVQLPGGLSTLVQISIGILDLSCCALAMYMLLPDEPNIGFVYMAVIFVMATMLGFASHAPGGLGVFDAAMLVALWQYDKEYLLAGLLLFRLLYYLCPFVVALAILGAREILLSVRTPPEPAETEKIEVTAPIRSEIEVIEKTDAG